MDYAFSFEAVASSSMYKQSKYFYHLSAVRCLEQVIDMRCGVAGECHA